MIGTRPQVFLLTDFGTRDQYVAVMKAVVLNRCPDAQFIDITHEVEPQAVEQGSYLLESTWPWLPPEAVVLAVVDPGVGSEREPAVFCHEGRCVIGPNNGLFGFLPEGIEGRVLGRPEFWMEDVSSTFHGRDIFAPCAGYVAAGGAWQRLGEKVTRPVRISMENGAAGAGRVIHIDHFGNVITSIRVEGISMKAAKVWLESGIEVEVRRTYADVAPGEPVAYLGSTGRLEVAVRNGSAEKVLGVTVGDGVGLVR